RNRLLVRQGSITGRRRRGLVGSGRTVHGCRRRRLISSGWRLPRRLPGRRRDNDDGGNQYSSDGIAHRASHGATGPAASGEEQVSRRRQQEGGEDINGSVSGRGQLSPRRISAIATKYAFRSECDAQLTSRIFKSRTKVVRTNMPHAPSAGVMCLELRWKTSLS